MADSHSPEPAAAASPPNTIHLPTGYSIQYEKACRPSRPEKLLNPPKDQAYEYIIDFKASQSLSQAADLDDLQRKLAREIEYCRSQKEKNGKTTS
jgi:hypothetical protein